MCAHTNTDNSDCFFVRFGGHTTLLKNFDDQSTLKDVNDHIFERFGGCLPSKYHIEYYSVVAKKVLHLTEDIFKSKNNPFLSDPAINSQKSERVTDWVEMFIVDDTPSETEINLQPNIPLNTIPINDPIPISLSENQLNQDISQTNILTDDASISGDGLESLIATAPRPGIDGVLLLSPHIQNLLHEATVISENNVSSSDSDDEDSFDVEASVYPRAISQTSRTSLNEYSFPIESMDDIRSHGDRVNFIHDVHPNQKDQYLTSKFKLPNGSTTKKFKGGISYIQGVKTEENIKKKEKVLPQIQIPSEYFGSKNAHLLLFALHEKKLNGKRIGCINQHKGFLFHNQLNANAKLNNPIRIPLYNIQLNQNGAYELAIYLITKRNKQANNEIEIYRLNEQITIQLHPAEHIVSSLRKIIKATRLLCVIENNNEICWHTMGLSNFIQKNGNNAHPVLLHNSAMQQSISPVPKRRKV